MKKTVLITGGSRGIGAATVREFCAQGYETAFFYNKQDEAAQKISKETGALALKCDITDPEQVEESVHAARIYLGVQAFDVLVCNAGISVHGLITDMTTEQWKETFDVNLNGTFYVTKSVLNGMIERKDGSVIMVSSMWGETGASCESVYAASKAALIGFAKSLAKELGPSGIRVNVVSPGVIDTQMNACYSRETLDELAADAALMRLGRSEEVAKSIFFLGSSESSYITGQVIGVNGGFYI